MEVSMKRVQIALNVSNIDKAVEYYSKVFNVQPAKRKSNYVNFVVEEPAMKLVLIENAQAKERLNHLGVELCDTKDVQGAIDHLTEIGLAGRIEENTNCCYALQDKVWTQDPDATPWEFYTVLDQNPPPRYSLTSGFGFGSKEGTKENPNCCQGACS